jgi:hypothetical protein
VAELVSVWRIQRSIVIVPFEARLVRSSSAARRCRTTNAVPAHVEELIDVLRGLHQPMDALFRAGSKHFLSWRIVRKISGRQSRGILPSMADEKKPEDVLRDFATMALDVFKGSFGSLRNFLERVALPNCVDYFWEAKKETRDKTKREQTRHLFNAIVSLDSAVDYMFHEHTEAPTVTALIAGLPPEIGELRELANALKHCVRGNDRGGRFQPSPSKTPAKAVVYPKINVTVKLTNEGGPAGVKLDVSTEMLATANEILGRAFGYWFHYVQ